MNETVMEQKKGSRAGCVLTPGSPGADTPFTPEQPVTVGTQVEEHDASAYYDLKVSIHSKLLDRIEPRGTGVDPGGAPAGGTAAAGERLLLEDGVALNDNERKRIVVDIQNEVLGLGPLEPLLADATISDILVNTYKQVYVERFGKLQLTDVPLAAMRT